MYIVEWKLPIFLKCKNEVGVKYKNYSVNCIKKVIPLSHSNKHYENRKLEICFNIH